MTSEASMMFFKILGGMVIVAFLYTGLIWYLFKDIGPLPPKDKR